MIARPSMRKAIQDSAMELLRMTPLEKLSVKEIAANCGISVRTFYNNFHDKHNVVNSIFEDTVEPFLDAGLKEWYDHTSDFFVQNVKALRNVFSYQGQNNLAETVCRVEKEKLRRHIRPEVHNDRRLYEQVLTGIDFMSAGNIGMIKLWLYEPDLEKFFTEKNDLYGGLWRRLSISWPPIVMDHLSSEPIILLKK